MLESKSPGGSEDQLTLSLFESQSTEGRVNIAQEFGFKENSKLKGFQIVQPRLPSRLYFHWTVTWLFLCLVLIPWGNFLSSDIDLKNTLSLPTFNHPLGTDNLGRDLVLRLSGAFLGVVLPLWGEQC